MHNKSESIINYVNSLIKDYQDFPQPGILFKDICPVFSDPWAVRNIAKYLKENSPEFDKILVLESRGFIIGTAISLLYHKPMILARKKGKLPGDCVAVDYSLEYGKEQVLEVQKNCGIVPGDRVLIHDDVLATGGTALAASKLVDALGANVAGFSFLAQIDFLKGHEPLEHDFVYSLIHY